MRRSATRRIDGRRKEAGPLLGHKGEKMSRDHYTPNQSGLGLRLIREPAAQTVEKQFLLERVKKHISILFIKNTHLKIKLKYSMFTIRIVLQICFRFLR